ncbi:unnamed protein product [Acanthocheilonema viteae]|uniref:Uncharacterized protein n=1 Tax=Acanthocheilonema viteae TaxID=6277 RepID=A0A498SD94_ACAVI|nr:unnamed protein product [Acanthocheilonema viteae]
MRGDKQEGCFCCLEGKNDGKKKHLMSSLLLSSETGSNRIGSDRIGSEGDNYGVTNDVDENGTVLSGQRRAEAQVAATSTTTETTIAAAIISLSSSPPASTFGTAIHSPIVANILKSVEFGSYSSGVAIHELLEQYLGVACQRERINVQLTFNRKRHPEMTKSIREMIWRGRMCVGDNKSGSCCSQLNMIQDYHVVLVGYSKCGIEKTFFAGGFNFIAKVYFWGIGNVNEQFEIQCAVPFVESHVKAKMVTSRKPIRISSIDFVNTHHFSSPLMQAKPVSVRLGSNLHVAIEPTLEGMQERLHTYPLRCWITVPTVTDTTISAVSSKQLANSVELAHRYFIKDGCPSVDGSSVLAFLEQKTGTDRYAEWTKIKIPITHNLINPSLLNGSVIFDESVEYGRISLHCDVIFCTGQKLNGFQNTPTARCLLLLSSI